jgi:hypothetical protein
VSFIFPALAMGSEKSLSINHYFLFILIITACLLTGAADLLHPDTTKEF